jgi:hypothetical protein
MKPIVYAAIILMGLGTGVAMADDDDCNVPVSDWQPREALQQKLETQGWKVSRIKVDDGCYEVDATDEKGRRVEASYDPKTLEIKEMELDD